MKNIAVLVSGGGTNLQALIDAQNSGIIKSGRITLVLSSSREAYALQRAEKVGIETCVIERKEYPEGEAARNDYSAAIVETLKKSDIDLVVLAGFMYILDGIFTSAFENRIMNVHPALIPSFCGEGYYGLRVHRAALEKGVKLTGATVHFVTPVTDGGPIILQKAVDIEEGDTPEILQRRVMEEAEWKILPKAVELFCEDRLYIENNIVHIK